MLRSLRLHGLEEDSLRQFVCKYAGDQWEGFYESLFGYEDKLIARDRWGKGERGKPRPKYGAWRDPIVTWIDAKLQARKEAKDAKALQRIEEKSLEAQGENLVTARRKAQRTAEAMVATAAEMRKTDQRNGTVPLAVAKAVRDAAKAPEATLVHTERGLLRGRSTGVFDAIFRGLDPIVGARARFFVAAILLGGCATWMHQNGMLSQAKFEELKKAAETAVETKDVSALKDVRLDVPVVTRPLTLPMVPARIAGLLGGFSAGAAGLILLVSSFSRSPKLALFAVPGAAIAWLGPRFGVPDLGPLSAQYSSMAVGAGIAVVGLVLCRR
jgi:hypothetical protein